MILGVILTNGAPVIELKVRGSRDEVMVEGILDTGFNGFLCLPISLAVLLGLELIDAVSMELADGTLVEDHLVFGGQAEWDGMMREVDITLTHSEDALIGTAFLTGYRVELDYSTSTVSIEKTV